MKTIQVPDDHKVGMKVPLGGSSCASCKYLLAKNHCGNRFWLAWHNKDPLIPEPAARYCCDYYEERSRW